MAKRDWIVCTMDGNPICDDEGKALEFSTEKAALKRAKEWVQTSGEEEAWVYCLSHVVSRPTIEPDVEIVK